MNELLIEVLEVAIYLRHVLGLQLFLQQSIKVEIFKEWMSQYLLNATICSYSLPLVLFEKLVDEVLGIFRDENVMLLRNWVSDLSLFDQEVHSVLIFVEEWRNTNEHLVKEDAKGPPIDSVVMT